MRDWRGPPPVSLDKEGLPLPPSVASLAPSVVGGQPAVSVNVDPLWLAKQDAGSFPIVIDPTLLYSDWGPNNHRANGQNCVPCRIHVGNPDTTQQTWRSLIHF